MNTNFRSAILTTAIGLAVLVSGGLSQSQDAAEPNANVQRLVDSLERRAQANEIQTRALAAYEARDYAAAAELFAEQAVLDPMNFVPHYNLACARSRLDDLDAAWSALLRAIETGFIDARQLARDESLARLREDNRYATLVERWPRLIEAHRASNAANTAKWMGARTQSRTLDSLRVELLSSHDATLTDDAVREIERVAAFVYSIIPQLAEPESDALDSWVVVALPSEDRFLSWSVLTFGPSARATFSQIGGAYDHDQRRLVAKDLGATLRHEFVHVLHWRDMNRRGIESPIWIQEGLASIVEDCDVVGQTLRPVPSWRTNIAKRLERSGNLPSIEQLTALSHERFSTSRPLRQYALARTFFLYLHDRGKLGEWYTQVCRTHDADPSGLVALSSVLGKPLDEIHADYRAWVRELPMVPESGDDLAVTMGLNLESGKGDGPVVVGFKDQSARRETGLRLGDVITSVSDQSTRDLQELIRVLGRAQPGQIVTVTYRRGRLHGRTDVPLRQRDPVP